MSFLLSSPSSTVYAMRTLSFWPKQQRNSAPEKKVERISSNTKISTETKQSESDVLRRVWLCRSFLFKFRVAFYFSVLWISVGFFPLVPFSSVFPLSTEVRPVFFHFMPPFSSHLCGPDSFHPQADLAPETAVQCERRGRAPTHFVNEKIDESVKISWL